MSKRTVNVSARTGQNGAPSNEHMWQLLRNIGSRREVDQYLKTYTEGDSKFAVIKIGGGVLVHQLEELVDALTFLHNVGLKPIVLHGAGPQLNARLASVGYESDYIEGLRVTDATVMKNAKEVFAQENSKLCKALEQAGCGARPMVHNVFEAIVEPDSKLGFVGTVTGVNSDMIESAVAGGYLPVLTCLASTAEGQLLNVNADLAAKALASAIQPMKVIYISEKGGIYDEHGEIMSTIDVGADYVRLMNSEWFKYGDRLKLKHFKTLLKDMPPSSSIVVTHVEQLARELFTHKGAGTLITNWEKIDIIRDLSQVNRHRLVSVIEDAFGGKLAHDYFKSIEHKFACLHVSEHYNAAAVILHGENGFMVMDKFIASSSSGHEQGTMLHRLWDSMVAEHPRLVWRARAENPINDWYFQRACGAVTEKGADGKDWRVFWYGLERLDDLPSVVRQMLNGPPTVIYDQNDRFVEGQDRKEKVKVGIIGARGYTGGEIVRILDNHPNMELVKASSRKWEGRRVSEIVEGSTCDVIFQNIRTDQLKEHSTSVDTWILALPNGVAAEYVRSMPPNVKCVDLSADFRFHEVHENFCAPEESDEGAWPAVPMESQYWQYGLPERKGNRARIAKAQFVSNPGCYATGAQIGMLPLLNGSDLRVIGVPRVFGVSGYSGAGADPCDKNDPERLAGNLIPYALANHMHEREVSHQLQEWLEQDTVAFSPHVAHFFRGIHLTISVDFQTGSTKSPTEELFYKRFKRYYQDEPFIQVQRKAPEVQAVANTHGVIVGGFTLSPNKRRLTFVAVIDNLLKGAASQCVQNINIMNGLHELEGLTPLKHYLEKRAHLAFAETEEPAPAVQRQTSNWTRWPGAE